jgi:NitT/TauT family transport system permease protein
LVAVLAGYLLLRTISYVHTEAGLDEVVKVIGLGC